MEPSTRRFDYSSSDTLSITPTAVGRGLIEPQERIADDGPVADMARFIAAVKAQTASEAKLAWPSVRPVLMAVRKYWEEAGYSAHGIWTAALVTVLPEERRGLFGATVRGLVEADYLRPPTDLELRISGSIFAAEVALTDRSRSLLDGWPGADPAELVEPFLAVIVHRIEEESDDGKKRGLKKRADSVRELGTPVAGEVLARVLLGQ